MTILPREYCPNCDARGHYDGVHCRDCGYGRNKKSIGAKDSLAWRKAKADRQMQIERNVKALRDHPVTKKWNAGRIANIADLMVTLKLNSPDLWLQKGRDWESISINGKLAPSPTYPTDIGE
jgi:ribosomal protein L40E